MKPEVLQSIDSLVRRGQRVYGWGWVLAKGAEITDLQLVAGNVVLDCTLSGEREDVTNYFGFPGTHAMGYLIVGSLPEGDFEWSLLVQTSLGQVEVKLPGFPNAFTTSDSDGNPKVSPTVRKIRGKIARDGVAATAKRMGEATASLVRARLQAAARKLPGKAAVVIDHDLGGGANRFRRELCGRLMDEGRDVLLIHPELRTLSYRMKWLNKHSTEGILFPDVESAFESLGSIRVSEIHLSDLVSFDNPGWVLTYITGLRKKGAKLFAYLNDYYSACPSWTLTDKNGRFCDVPDLDACAKCLPKVRTTFKSFIPPEITLEAWRDQWHAFLQRCEEITAFSQDSRRIFSKSFPDLAPKVVVRPHRVDYLGKAEPIPYRAGGVLRIGVLGHISGPKGADVLRDMIRKADRESIDVEFVIFGSMERPPESPRLKLVGLYDPNSLPQLFEASNIAICFLPSVCSETFSYVTAEIMHFGMPLAVFPLGAPAERVGNYKSGLVLGSVSPETALCELLSFGRTMMAARIGGLENRARVGA